MVPSFQVEASDWLELLDFDLLKKKFSRTASNSRKFKNIWKIVLILMEHVTLNIVFNHANISGTISEYNLILRNNDAMVNYVMIDDVTINSI